MAVQKVAFSLPSALYQTVEKARRRTRQSRSGVMQDALRLWLARERETHLVRRYVEAYGRQPEARDEGAPIETVGLESWADLPW